MDKADKIRQRGLSIHRPIIYGNSATVLSPEEKAHAPTEHSHRWTLAIRSPAPGREPDSVGGADDLSYFIKRVVFKLHETYPTPNRTVDKPPFEISETGWGEFEIQIRITFIPEAGEKPLTLFHHLKLHPWPAVPTIDALPDAEVPVPTDRPEPVHSWQYDEIVFTEPQQAFLNILMRNPPTPLPKARRKMVTNTPETSAFLTGKGNPEFTQDMEKDESDRLEETRKALIAQGEEWRMKLIQLENEVQSLRREVDGT